MTNKYYVADLSPGQSMMEWAVKQGQQVFMISWRNPGSSHTDWNYDTYCAAVLEALDAAEAITGSERTHLMGLCAGGTIATMVTAHLAATAAQDRMAGLILGVNALDTSQGDSAESFLDEITAAWP